MTLPFLFLNKTVTLPVGLATREQGGGDKHQNCLSDQWDDQARHRITLLLLTENGAKDEIVLFVQRQSSNSRCSR